MLDLWLFSSAWLLLHGFFDMNLFKNLKFKKEEKERLELEQKQLLLSLNLKVFNLEWRLDELEKQLKEKL